MNHNPECMFFQTNLSRREESDLLRQLIHEFAAREKASNIYYTEEIITNHLSLGFPAIHQFLRLVVEYRESTAGETYDNFLEAMAQQDDYDGPFPKMGRPPKRRF